MFSFFRRRFYRSTAPVIDENNNDADDFDDELDPEECSLDDYDARGLRRVTATGVDERSNDVLLRVARTAAATANVVFFPGDVQDFHSSMLSGSYAEYDAFSYEHTAELLAAKFGDAANVWIVRPSRFQFGAFACFDGFVDTNKVGAATSYPSNGSAVEQLVTLMESVRQLLEQDPGEEHAGISTFLPVHLVGFSKGGVVLNQIATELATRWRETPSRVDEDVENNNPLSDPTENKNNDEHVETDVETEIPVEPSSPGPHHVALCRQFAGMISSIHWLDSGNGSKPGAVPLAQQTLVGLGSLRTLQLCVHMTPYQFESSERPWIQKEVVHFVAALTRLDANVALLKYAEHEPATLASHFEILREFQLPAVTGNGKTGQAHSPEVALTPVAIQTRA